MIRKQIADYPLAMVALLLTAFGIAVVYSAGQTEVPNAGVQAAWTRQLMWLAVGLTAFMVTSRMSVRFLEWAALPAYVLAITLLVITLIFGSGAGTAESMKGWLTIGGRRLGQPSEFAKIAVALMLAKVLSSYKVAPRSLVDLIKPAIVVLVPWILVMLQPDLGTGIVFIGLFFAMLFWSGVSGTLLLFAVSPVVSLLLAGSSGLWGAWFILLLIMVWITKPYVVEGVVLIVGNLVMGVAATVIWDRVLDQYQRERLLVFLDPSRDPQASGYQVAQSRIAIGSGGWTGKGFTEGSQKRLAFLPAQHTDFIFAVVGEELGFLGVATALTLFLLLFLRIIRVATRASDSFSSLVAFGLAGSWFVHVIINVGMTINLMPITGIPLPFFSYGGSFLLACWIAVGMLVRISAEGRGRPGELGLALGG
jgi:rod shape determining protein RodA